MEKLFNNIQYVKGIGPKRSKQLEKLGIYSVFDLLWHLPRAYINRENMPNIAEAKVGEYNHLQGRVVSVNSYRVRNGLHILKAILKDQSGFIQAVWFNQPFVDKYIKIGQNVYVSGRVKSGYEGLELNVAEYELVDEFNSSKKIIPVYPLTEGLNQKFFRQTIFKLLKEFLPYYIDIFPEFIKEKYNLGDIRAAFYNMHFPEGREAYRIARRRLAVEELFLFQLSIKKTELINEGYIIHREITPLVAEITENLPFDLTNAQKRVLNEIFIDLEKPRQMNRLLQGDVGSGKTVVAALTMAKSVASSFQAALMAPTEILADQHYDSLIKFFNQTSVVIARLTGSTPTAEKAMILEALETGDIDIVVGTHALIQDNIVFKNLGLAVIDEQHRFGVKQRASLANKGDFPDILVMTATPIPRTLALTVYGDLDLSVIDELPPGRKPIKTFYIKNQYRHRVYNYVKDELSKGVQIYVVCPLIEESEKQDLKAATTLYEELKNGILSDFRIGLLHGRLKSAEKEYIMHGFKQGEIDLLVTTTVIEVGVDVPNASIIVIEQAHRFGLSQLHQLRGRVGRGNTLAYCFLIAEPNSEEALHRLKAMEKTNDGFILANEDLAIRGPGDFLGVRQHGLDQLKVANLSKDRELVELSKAVIKEEFNFNNFDKYIQKKFYKSKEIAPN
ncbi:MAG: ATP-dependent DNA helicase RecG [Syntrophomonadaceae bacterium]|nr:ATP-dependent DNA helicase RecG [Syntrophomonadaceae bacterium]